MSHPEGHVPKRAPLWKRQLVRMINWPLSGVICVSEYNYNCIATLDLLPAKRFKRIYNGVDFSRVPRADQEKGFAFRLRYNIPRERIVIAQVSWIIAEKGVADLLETARIVVSKNSNTHFVLVGEGADRQSFMQQAERMGLGGNITWTGLVRIRPPKVYDAVI